MIFGDRGRVEYRDEAGRLRAAIFEAATTCRRGPEVPDDATDGVERPMAAAYTVDPTEGDGDVITAGGGADRSSAARHYTIHTGDGNDVAFGDNGRVDTTIDDGDPADVDRITTANPAVGGDDVLTLGGGTDIALGGNGGDAINGGDGSDLLLGDHGLVTGDVDASQLPFSPPAVA